MRLKSILVVFAFAVLVSSAPKRTLHKKKKLVENNNNTTTTSDLIEEDTGGSTDETDSNEDVDDHSGDEGSTSLERIGFQQETTPKLIHSQQTNSLYRTQQKQVYANSTNTYQQQQQQQPTAAQQAVFNNGSQIVNSQSKTPPSSTNLFKNNTTLSALPSVTKSLSEKEEEQKCFNDFGKKMNATEEKTARILVGMYEDLHKCLSSRKCNFKKAEDILDPCVRGKDYYHNYTCYYSWYEQIKKDCDPSRIEEGDEKPKEDVGKSPSSIELKRFLHA